MRRGSLATALLVLLACPTARPARADRTTEQARVHYTRATTAFGLGKFAEAADEYERAFDLKPDSALLFDAAQAHRSAGNRERALLLYRNYLRLFGTRISNRAEVEQQVANLKAELQSQVPPASPSSAAPPVPAPSLASPVPPSSVPSPTPAAKASAAPATPQDGVRTQVPNHRPRWVWPVVIGSVAVGALAVGLGVGLGTQRTPSPTLGGFTVGLTLR